MAAYDVNDPLGIGVATGASGMGFGLAGASDFSLSYRVLTEPSFRRRVLAALVQWLQAHRGTKARPSHTYDEVLEGGLWELCEKVASDGRTELTHEQRAALVAHRLAELEQSARNELFKALKANPKVQVTDGDHLAFRPLHPGLHDKEALAAYLARFSHGLPADELADAYAGVQDDIAELLAEGRIFALKYVEKAREVLFPVDQSVRCSVDADLRALWSSVQVPRSVPELEEALWRAGHLSREQYQAGHLEKSRQSARGLQAAKDAKLAAIAERKAKRKRYPTKVTNAAFLESNPHFKLLMPNAK